MQKRLKLKPIAISVIYLVVTISLVVSLMLLGNEILKVDPPVDYITSSTITEDIKPVINETKTFVKPYKDKDVKILQNFYDYKDKKENQEKSLIMYENTYLQNSGVDYGKEKEFNVLAIYPGVILNVYEDDILGKTIEIQHANNIIATYQCVDNIKVKKDDTVVIGQTIATSGTCNISKNLGKHLHLEISKDGQVINPESIFDKTIEEM